MTTERTAICTRRLQLEPVGPHHSSALYEAVAASSAELRPWLFWAVDHSLDKSREFTKRCLDLWGVSQWTFAICESDRLIGCVGLDSYESFLSSAEIGYWLRTDRAGRGLMTEAAGAVVDFAFGELNLHRIELHADTRNAASIRVAEKLGFARVGLLREGERGEDGWHDCYVFDRLATDRPQEQEPE